MNFSFFTCIVCLITTIINAAIGEIEWATFFLLLAVFNLILSFDYRGGRPA